MARNLDCSKKYPKQIPAGEDNRARARFLPGYTGQNTEFWLRARKEVGLDPVSKYDFEGMGASDRINSWIIAMLHNPGTTQFSIKMLSRAALEAARGGAWKKNLATQQ
jgi:hypothetical protein